MKRNFHGGGEIDSVTSMANCLMLLSQGSEFPSFPSYDHAVHNNSISRVYECKTCNRQFPSFQALGGHRASHKKHRVTGGNGAFEGQSLTKPKTHECAVCGLGFAVGQALGGHMRRHRAGALNDQNHHHQQQPPLIMMSRNCPPPMTAPLMRNSNSRSVFGLDLNLTPLENDLNFSFKIIV